MTLRQRVSDIIGGKELRTQREQDRATIAELYNAYQMGRFNATPQMLAAKLQEYGSATVIQLIRQMQSSNGWYIGDTESARQYQVNESRQQWLYSPLAQWSVNTWTSYGLGEGVTITCNDADAQPVWDEVAANSTILADDEIQGLSSTTCVDGEIFVAAFISIADGKVSSFELLDNDEITDIVKNPANKMQPIYYKREYNDPHMVSQTLYYPDWHTLFYHKDLLTLDGLLPQDAKTTISGSMDDGNGTTVVVLHIAHNRKDSKSLRGWPILGIAAPYLDAHKSFVEDRLTVSHIKASISRDITVQGGSRGVAAVKSRFGSQLGIAGATGATGYIDPNPPPVAGSSLIHNQGITYTDLPMTTGAGDASTDNNMFSWMALIGAGLFPTSAGLDTSRWATAVAMDKTQAVQWARYQSFWSCQFSKMVEIVLLAAEKWGGATYEDKGCTVSIDTLSLVDFPGVAAPIASMLATLTPSIADGTLQQQPARQIIKALWQPILTALGAESIDEILSDENLGIMTPEEQAQAQKQQGALTELALEIYRARVAEKAGSK